MQQLLISKKNSLEKYIQNSDINSLSKLLDKVSLSIAIDLLSVDKNIKLFSKKADFNFMYETFKKFSSLYNPKFLEFLKVSNDAFFLDSAQIKTSHNHNKINDFIIKSVDLAIHKNKKHNLNDVSFIFKIAHEFNIDDKKLVNWLGKIICHSGNPTLLDLISKNSLFQNKQLKDRFISLVINVSSDISILDKLFLLYEKNIYELFAKYKSENKIWNCLLPKSSYYYNSQYLPYIDNDKLKWIEDKKIGYDNHPVNFKIIQIKDKFLFKNNMSESMDNYIIDNEFQNIILDSLIDFKKDILPIFNNHLNEYLKNTYLHLMKNNIENQNGNTEQFSIWLNNLSLNDTKNFILETLNINVNKINPNGFSFSDENKKFRNWINEKDYRKSLSVFIEEPSFFDFCEKFCFKEKLEFKLKSNNNSSKPKKI